MDGPNNEIAALVHQLEHNANILLASPHTLSNNGPDARRNAESVFQEFRRRRNPFSLCRHILATTQNSFVQHQTAACLHTAVIRDWNLLDATARHELLSYLIATVNGAAGGDCSVSMAHYVREELLLVAAILLKRLACEEDEAILESVLGSLCAALVDSACDLRHRLVAVSFLIAVLREYASSTRASDFGLPWKRHMRAKNSFEHKFLKRIFQAVLTSLERTLALLTAAEQPAVSVADECRYMARVLEALESILMWNFNIVTIFSVNYARHLDTVEAPSLSPPGDWRDIFLNSHVVQFFFQVLVAFRTHPRLINQIDEQTLHRSLQCASQLSSLSGSILANPANRIQFTGHLMGAVMDSVNHLGPAHMRSREWVCLTTVINRVIMNLQCRDLIYKVDINQLRSFLNMMAQLLCSMMSGVVRMAEGTNGICSDDTKEQCDLAKGAIDTLCDSWQAFVVSLETQDNNRAGSNNGSDEVDARLSNNSLGESTPFVPLMVELRVTEFTKEIFTTFVRCHLCAPDGFRSPSAVLLEDEEEIQDDYEPDDRVTYADQLNTMGTLSRLDAAASIQLLSDAFKSRLAQYNQLITMYCQTGQRLDGLPPADNQAQLRTSWMNVNEDLHWLLLVSANLLTQTSYDTQYQIPKEVMHVSIATTTATPTENCEAVLQTDPTRATDPIVRLVSCILQLCSLERAVLVAGRSDLLSPQTCFSVTTFVSRFAQGYLMPDESQYQDMSLVINACWGRDSQTAASVLDSALLSLVAARLTHWSAEQTLAQESADMLVSFVLWSPTRSAAVALSPTFNTFIGQNFASLPLGTRKSLCQFMVMVGSSLQSKSADKNNSSFDGSSPAPTSAINSEQLDRILSGFAHTFQEVRRGLSDSRLVATEAFHSKLIDMYECIQGMALAVTPSNVPTVWKRFIEPIFTEFPRHLTDTPLGGSSTVVSSLLETVRELADRVLVYLSEKDQMPFYSVCMDLLVAYSKTRPVTPLSNSTQEEETYNDILLIIQLLQEIAQKEYIDWTPNLGTDPNDSTNSAGSTPAYVAPVQVVFWGLNMLRPLMTEELLKFPRLCEAYYKLIAFICEDPDYAHITNGDQALLAMVILSCQLALRSSYSPEVKCHSLEIISLLCGHTSRSPDRYPSLGQALAPLLSDVWRFVLTDCVHSTGDMTLRDQVASAFFGLISLNADSDPGGRLTMAKCDQLLAEILPTLTRASSSSSSSSSIIGSFQVTPELLSGVMAASHALIQTTDLHNTRPNKSTFKQHFESFIIELQGLICIK